MMETRTLFISALSVGLMCCVEPDANQPTLTVEIRDASGALLRTVDDCGAGDDCTLRGGEETLTVQMTYADLEFDEAADVPSPTLALFADGASMETSATFRQIAGTPPRFEAGPIRVPAEAHAAFSVRASVATGYSAELSGFKVVAPDFQATVADCDGDGPCALTRGVGDAHLVIESYAAVGAEVVVSGQVDSTPSVEVGRATLAAGAVGEKNRAVITVAVPDRGSKWRLQARTPTAAASSVTEVELAAPEIDVVIAECASQPCTLERGSSVNVVVAAPRELHDTTASVRVLVDGILGATISEVPLAPEGDNLLGIATFALPDKGASWRVRVLLGEENGKDSSPVSLVAPPP
jgi:hypothetical protein